jgi:hypothetical protein
MNPAHTIRRLARTLTAALAAALACAAAPAALAIPRPLPPGWNKHPPLPASAHPAINYYPPGWNKHPPLPAHAHTLAAGGLPGWQLTLIVVLAAGLATALAVTYRLRVARRRVSVTTA